MNSAALSAELALRRRIDRLISIDFLTSSERKKLRQRNPEKILAAIEERIADGRAGLAAQRRKEGTQAPGRISDAEALAHWMAANVRSASARAASERFGLVTVRQLDLFGDAPERRGRPRRARKGGDK